MSLFTQFIEITDPCLQLKNGNRVFSSLEGENPGGSMKDHMVRGEIEDLLKKKMITRSGGISEVSAGSTAASLAYYCPRYGLKCVLFVPTTVDAKILDNLRDQGAEIHQEEMKSIYSAYDQFLTQQSGLFRFDQLFDTSKRRHYHHLGMDVWRNLGLMDAIIGSVGTGHSLLGTAEGIGQPLIISAEPAASLKVSGVRNVIVDRYGDRDEIQADNFDQRLIVAEKDLLNAEQILTSVGLVQIPKSFDLVLSALSSYLRDKSDQKIFAVGASLKRIKADVIRQAA